jgi:uncharacterized damage-inducible protein DinB
MNTREYFVECFKSEKPRFIRVLKAVPPDQLAYRPHPRSNSAGAIVWMLASELQDACALADRREVNYKLKPEPATLGESVAAFEKNAGELEKRMATLDDAAWAEKARFLVDGNVAWETSLGDMLWGILFDGIHHRGQLSSYLRPMGGKVPSIYGPSADDPGM